MSKFSQKVLHFALLAYIAYIFVVGLEVQHIRIKIIFQQSLEQLNL